MFSIFNVMNKNRKIILCVVFFLFLMHQETAMGAFERFGGGARAKSLSGAFTAYADDYNAIVYNPAGLVQCKSAAVSFFYELPFGIKELGTTTAALSFPFRYGGGGIMVQQMGNNVYKESRYILSYGKDISDNVCIGASIKFLHLGIKNYGSAGVLGIDAGCIYTISDDLKFGLFASNLNKPRIGRQQEEIPGTYAVGISKRILPEVTINLDLQKQGEYPASIRCGTEMSLLKQFRVCVGFSDNPAAFAGGFGIELKHASIHYCISNHSRLGITNQFSLSLHIK